MDDRIDPKEVFVAPTQIVTITSEERDDRISALVIALSQPMESDNSHFVVIGHDIYDSLKPYVDTERIIDIEITTIGKKKLNVEFVFAKMPAENRALILRAIHKDLALRINSRDDYVVPDA
jgi:hypothetical protein